MMKYTLFLFLTSMTLVACKVQKKTINNAHTVHEAYMFAKDSLAIIDILKNQEKAWNEGNLVAFMNGYWDSEDLLFIGGNGVTKGWKQTLINYQKGYPTKEKMGFLHFDILDMKSLGTNAARVIGKYMLTYEGSRPFGHFTLIFEKKGNEWLITSDMTAEGKTQPK